MEHKTEKEKLKKEYFRGLRIVMGTELPYFPAHKKHFSPKNVT